MPDLFDFIVDDSPRLCEHAYRVGSTKSDAWTLEANPDALWVGHYVHSDPDCRRPAHTNGA